MVWALSTQSGASIGKRGIDVALAIGSHVHCEAQLHVHIGCTGPADSASVWRHRTSRRLVDPAARRLPRVVHVPRLRDLAGIPRGALHVRSLSLTVLLPGVFWFVTA